MKTLIKLLSLSLLVCVAVSCDKENPSRSKYSFVNAADLTPIPDLIECHFDGEYSPKMVAFDGKNVLPATSETIKFEFLEDAGNYFVYSGSSASRLGYEGLHFGFAARKAAEIGQKGKVRVRYDNGEVAFERTFNLSAQPEAIDMGGSVLWASCNIGAKARTNSGDYFAWGETEAKTSFFNQKEGDYKWGVYGEYSTSKDGLTKYSGKAEGGDGLNVLELKDDAARQAWGGKWRMPTYKEFEELYRNPKIQMKWDAVNQGYVFTEIKTGNSIFLPAAGTYEGASLRNYTQEGFYWTSTLEQYHPQIAFSVMFSTILNYEPQNWSALRHEGLSIRPVMDKQ